MTTARRDCTVPLRRTALAGVLAVIAGLTIACTSAPAQDAGSTGGASATASAAAGLLPETGASSDQPSGGTVATAESGADPAAGSTPESTLPAQATTPVPPPSTGGIDQTVENLTQPTLAPVPFSQAAEVGPQLTATVTQVESVTAEGRGPGEFSGPALAFHVTLTNGSDQPAALDSVTVNAQDASGQPLSSIEGSPAQPFSGSVPAGESATGIYVFTIPAGFSDPATLSVSTAANAPIAQFVGNAS